MTVLFFVLGGCKILSYWFLILGLFIDLFVYSLVSKLSDNTEFGIIAGVLTPLFIIFCIVYYIFKGICYLYKKPIDYIVYKTYGRDLEKFLLKYNMYSQFMNILNNKLHITFEEYIRKFDYKNYIDAVKLYDTNFNYLASKWNK